MGLYSSINIAGSGLSAQRTRLDSKRADTGRWQREFIAICGCAGRLRLALGQPPVDVLRRHHDGSDGLHDAVERHSAFQGRQ